MKKKMTKEPCTATVVMPPTLKTEFRKICVLQDLQPSETLQKIVSDWVEKQKKKQNIALVVNA